MRNPTLGELDLRPPVRVSPTATLRQAAADMEDEHVSALLVGEAPPAIVTEYDLAGALAAGLTADAPVSEVATKAPLWATTASTLADAVRMMSSCGVRHLLVLSPDGVERGVLSLGDATRVLLSTGAPSRWETAPGTAHVEPGGGAGGAPRPTAPGELHTIAVGVDGSADAEAALHWAIGLARRTGATVVAVHALGLLDHITGGKGEEIEAAVRRTADAEGMPPGVLRYVVDNGEPCSVLCRAAGPPIDADLLVVGSRGRGAHAGLLLGSTSHALSERAGIPLVIVPGPASGPAGPS